MEFLRNVIMVLSAKNTEEAHGVLKFTTFSAQNVDAVLENIERERVNELVALLSRIVEFYKEVKVATNPYLWVELMAIELCASAQKLEVPEKAVKVEKVPEKPQNAVVVQAEPTEVVEEIVEKVPERPVKKAAINIQEAWTKIVESIESVPAKFFFSGVAKLVSLDDEAIVVGFAHQNALLQANSKRQALEKALESAFEKKPEVQFIVISKNTPAVEANIEVQKKPEKPRPDEVPQSEDYVENAREMGIFPQYSSEETENSTKTALEPASEEAPAESGAVTAKKPEGAGAAYSSKTREMIENYNGKIID
jgi:DNA polymerase III gamma/tau subunit